MESLLERETIDGIPYIALSPLGQIFHDGFRDKYAVDRERLLPQPARKSEKRAPVLERAGWPGKHPEVARFLRRVTEEVPQVIQCRTRYYNPDLSRATLFRLGPDGVEGVYSPDGWTVRFMDETTATTAAGREEVVAALNEWLHRQ